MLKLNIVSFGILLVLSLGKVNAQEGKIDWLSFAQLEDSLAIKPKKVFIDFYAEWCAYCKKMDRAAFRDPKVIKKLNADFYAVKMDVETTEKIEFGGDTFLNKEIGKKRNPTHEIPLLLASRPNVPFSLPAIVVLNEKFEVVDRRFEYLSPKKLSTMLENL